MKLSDHPASAGCLKGRIVLCQLGLAYETVANDLGPFPAHVVERPI